MTNVDISLSDILTLQKVQLLKTPVISKISKLLIVLEPKGEILCDRTRSFRCPFVLLPDPFHVAAVAKVPFSPLSALGQDERRNAWLATREDRKGLAAQEILYHFLCADRTILRMLCTPRKCCKYIHMYEANYAIFS